jgi:NAD+ synthase
MKDRYDHAIDTLRAYIVDTIGDADATGIVVGVSGGIDSAVVCALCAPVVDTTALLMPDGSLDSHEDTKDGIEVCKSCGVPYAIIDLGTPLDAIQCGYPHELNDRKYVMANVKPRLRMTYLYMVANSERRLVAGTSNKTERILGYSTKWGDCAADFAPLGDVWKTDVFPLAERLGIPEHIIKKSPSARLWEGQTDEQEIGGTYAQIDAILKKMEKEGEDSVKRDTDALGASLLERIRSNSHKSAMPPFPSGVL